MADMGFSLHLTARENVYRSAVSWPPRSIVGTAEQHTTCMTSSVVAHNTSSLLLPMIDFSDHTMVDMPLCVFQLLKS